MTSAIHLPRRWGGNQVVPAIVALLCLSRLLFVATRPLRDPDGWYGYVQDDFFYYDKIALNLARGRGSSFNGIVRTNGYHPLWLIVLAAFHKLSNASTVWLLVGVVSISLLATFWFSLKLSRRYIAFIPAVAVSILTTTFSMQLFTTGMEVVLTIPLLFLYLLLCLALTEHEATPKRLLALSMCGSLAVLSRIDTALIVCFLFAATCLPCVRRRPAALQAAAVGAGFSPVLIYLAINHWSFGSLLPISGVVKQMKATLWPALPAWRSLWIGPIHHFGSFAPILAAILILPWVWAKIPAKERLLIAGVLLWPFAYILLLSCRSDWMLWAWYFYPLRLAFCVACVVLLLAVEPWQKKPVVGVLLCLAAFGRAVTASWTTGDMPQMVAAAEHVSTFGASHPGIYAMGDRAGIVAYLLQQPLVPDRGALVMDTGYASALRIQAPLADVLRAYKVRYYIATIYQPLTQCQIVTEPAQAGSHSPRMKATLCMTPTDFLDQGDIRTVIYDLSAPAAH